MPESISLFFGPEFGTIHTDHGRGQTYFVVDEIWANRVKVATPIIEGNFQRTTFQLGRHEDCWVCFGAGTVTIKLSSNSQPLCNRPAQDSLGVSVFDVWSRVQCTLVYDKRENDWEWVIMTGGVFLDKSKTPYERVPIPDPKSGVYLNAQRLKPKDQIALFKGDKDFAYLCFGYTGKIFIKAGEVGEDSTALPENLWTNGLWPTLQQVKLDNLESTQKRFEIEQKTLKEQTQTEAKKIGSTWPDVAMVVINGPPGLDKRLWWLLLATIVLIVLWLKQ